MIARKHVKGGEGWVGSGHMLAFSRPMTSPFNKPGGKSGLAAFRCLWPGLRHPGKDSPRCAAPARTQLMFTVRISTDSAIIRGLEILCVSWRGLHGFPLGNAVNEAD